MTHQASYDTGANTKLADGLRGILIALFKKLEYSYGNQFILLCSLTTENLLENLLGNTDGVLRQPPTEGGREGAPSVFPLRAAACFLLSTLTASTRC